MNKVYPDTWHSPNMNKKKSWIQFSFQHLTTVLPKTTNQPLTTKKKQMRLILIPGCFDFITISKIITKWFLSVQLIKLLKSSINWTVHQIGINNGIYGFWIISPYLMIKRLHSGLRTVALVTWSTSWSGRCIWRGGGSVFLWQADNGGGGLKCRGGEAAPEFVKLDIISICKELLWKGLKDYSDYYISDKIHSIKRCFL